MAGFNGYQQSRNIKFKNKNLPKKKDMTCYYTHYSLMIDWMVIVIYALKIGKEKWLVEIFLNNI